MRRTVLLAVTAAVLFSSPGQAQVYTVYDTVTPAPSAGYGELNTNNPIFGDAITLPQGGQLEQLRFDIYNSTTGGNSGTIQTGTMNIKVYDDTKPYTGGSLAANDPLITSINFSLDFSGSGGLPAGFFSRITSNDLLSLNVFIPANIFITQQWTELTGTSTANGDILSGSNSAIGSSPATVYINSSATPENLYAFGGGNLNQFAFAVGIAVPEPGSLALCGLGLAGIPAWYRRRRAG